MKKNNNMLSYIRNNDGDLEALKYNDNVYYYIKNAQNDVIGLMDCNLKVIVNYEYDSWGNILSVTDADNNEIVDITHIGHINPYRYRSYCYDKEINLYYLNNRYYNPKWGRYINADTYGRDHRKYSKNKKKK